MRLLWLLCCLALPAFAGPVKGRERVIVHTLAGDMVFALFPEAAPKTVAQFLRLVRHGVYDSSHFRRLEPGFVLQTGVAADRVIALSAVQQSVLQKIPGEFAPGLKHHRGTLSMAHYDGQPDSGETSFSILLGDAPHLDGKYTIFGEMEFGSEVLSVLESVDTNSDKTPKMRLSIGSVEVADKPSALAGRVLLKAIPLSALSQEWERQLANDRTRGELPLGIVLAALVLLSSIGALIGKKLRSVLLLNALIGGFALFCWQAPLSHLSPLLAVLLFFGTAALFRALSFFESPAR